MDVAAESRLFTPRQIYVASFLGSPLAAGWLFRLNYRALRDSRRANNSMLLALAATVAVLVIAFSVTDRFPNYVLPISYSFALYFYAGVVFDKPVKAHLSSGGKQGSWWIVIGVGFACLAALLVAIFGGLLLLSVLGFLPDVSDGT